MKRGLAAVLLLISIVFLAFIAAPAYAQTVSHSADQIQSGTIAGVMTVNGTTGRVGIGVAAPAGKLHIGTAPTVWSGYNFGANLVIDGLRNNAIAMLDATSGNPWAIVNRGGTFGLAFATMPPLSDSTTFPVSRLSILPNGNVGIGVGETLVASKLSVGGGVAVGSAYATTAAPDGNVIVSGNVGIGRMTPLSTLDVNGIIRTPEICDENGASCKDVSAGWATDLWTLSGSNVYRATGNVGIGTASPVAKLDVAGWIKSKTGYVDRNMLDSTVWTVGTGGIGDFSQNGDTAENGRVWDVDPLGRPALVWRSVNDAGSDADGGWNYGSIPIDNNKAYRSSIWIKKVGTSSGTVYLGCDAGNTLNLDNSVNSNPYFQAFASSNLVSGRWYLLVGYIHANNDASTTSYSGVYDGVTGKRVLGGTDYKNRGATSYQVHRTYNFYDTVAGSTQYFWGPRFEELDGNEPSIESLLGVSQGATNEVTSFFGGNVGIGTTTPAAKLDIAGTGDGTVLLKFSTERPWQFEQIGTGPSTALVLAENGGGGKDFNIRAKSGYTFVRFHSGANLGESGVYLMPVAGDGNVAIGPGGDPYEKLSVGGAVAATGASVGESAQGPAAILQYNGGGKLTAVDWGDSYKQLTLEASNINFAIGSGSVATRMVIDGSGNVGIGTTTPSAKLHVAGTSQFGGIINTDNNWISGDGGAEGIYVADSGNVGIGTTNPLAGLSVGGGGYANTGVYGYATTYGVRGNGGTYGVYGYGNNGVYGEGTNAGVIANGGAYGVQASGGTYDFIGGGNSHFGNVEVAGSADVAGDLSFGAHNAKLYTIAGATCLPGDYRLVSHIPARTCTGFESGCGHWYSDCSQRVTDDCSGATSCSIAEGWSTTGSTLTCYYIDEACDLDSWTCYEMGSYSCTSSYSSCASSPDYTICIDDA